MQPKERQNERRSKQVFISVGIGMRASYTGWFFVSNFCEQNAVPVNAAHIKVTAKDEVYFHQKCRIFFSSRLRCVGCALEDSARATQMRHRANEMITKRIAYTETRLSCIDFRIGKFTLLNAKQHPNEMKMKKIAQRNETKHK